jgi:hypothetical protein
VAEGSVSNPNVIAVQGMDADSVGGIVFWRLSGSVLFDDLDDAWRAAGITGLPFPGLTRPHAALARAVGEVADRSDLVRPLRAGDERGVVLVREVYSAGRPTYAPEAEFTLDKGTGVLVCTSQDAGLLAQVRRAYDYALCTLTQSDVGAWLVQVCHVLHAVRLRDTGGVYFVPRERMAQWRAVAAVMRAATACTLYEIPALRTDEAVSAVLDAVRREADELVHDMRAELKEQAPGTQYSKRQLATRESRLEAMRAKLAGYEQLLDVNMDAVRDKLTDVGAELVVGALAGMQAVAS